jgi:prephenate dehydrogenase
MADSVHFSRVAIIGVGLIGGSLAMAMRRKGLVDRIVGVGRGIENLDAAKAMGAVDTFTQDAREGVEGADLVVVAVPVAKTAEVVRMAAPGIKPGCIVTDVGSVKKAVIDAVEPLLPEGAAFVPGHPIAGTENSGVGAAFPELFSGRRCILTPTPRTRDEALRAVKAMWEEVGCEVELMDAAMHDSVLAAVSHLPHMIAYALVNTVAGEGAAAGCDMLRYSAGGFKDFTRIASSSPEMWADICAMNGAPIAAMMDGFIARLSALKRLIEANDQAALKAEFSRAKRTRDSLARGPRG